MQSCGWWWRESLRGADRPTMPRHNTKSCMDGSSGLPPEVRRMVRVRRAGSSAPGDWSQALVTAIRKRGWTMQVQQVMTGHVVSVSMDDTLETVRNLFASHRFHHVVVMEDCKIVGVISDRDLLRHLSPFAGQADGAVAGCGELAEEGASGDDADGDDDRRRRPAAEAALAAAEQRDLLPAGGGRARARVSGS